MFGKQKKQGFPLCGLLLGMVVTVSLGVLLVAKRHTVFAISEGLAGAAGCRAGSERAGG